MFLKGAAFAHIGTDRKVDPACSSDVGSSDWYCERAFIDGTAETEHRDRAMYLADIQRDRSILEMHLQRRLSVINRTKGLIQKKVEKRRGYLSR